jgi:hypothetical protein
VSIDIAPLDSITLRTATKRPSHVQARSACIVWRTPSGESIVASNTVPLGLTSIS